MMDLRSELELALIAVLKPAEGLESVRTFEASIRECLFTGDKMSAGFRPEELPAIAVSAQLKPEKESMFTASERGIDVPFSVTIVTRGQRKKEALAQAAALQDAVHRMVARCRKSSNGLGENAVVMGEVASSSTVIEEKPHSFAISTSEFTVLKVVEL